jgi:hypothetical protein
MEPNEAVQKPYFAQALWVLEHVLNVASSWS